MYFSHGKWQRLCLFWMCLGPQKNNHVWLDRKSNHMLEMKLGWDICGPAETRNKRQYKPTPPMPSTTINSRVKKDWTKGKIFWVKTFRSKLDTNTDCLNRCIYIKFFNFLYFLSLMWFWSYTILIYIYNFWKSYLVLNGDISPN